MIGCGSAATHENYDKALAALVGHSSDLLVANWGIPHGSYALDNGGKVLEYFASSTYNRHTPFNLGVYGTTYVTNTITSYCKVRFVVDSEGIITSYAWEGNLCVAEDPDS